MVDRLDKIWMDDALVDGHDAKVRCPWSSVAKREAKLGGRDEASRLDTSAHRTEASGEDHRHELGLADHAFFTGTAAELTPIREVDDRAIGERKPRPITKRLQARCFEVVRGSDDAHPEWYTTYASP